MRLGVHTAGHPYRCERNRAAPVVLGCPSGGQSRRPPNSSMSRWALHRVDQQFRGLLSVLQMDTVKVALMCMGLVLDALQNKALLDVELKSIVMFEIYRCRRRELLGVMVVGVPYWFFKQLRRFKSGDSFEFCLSRDLHAFSGNAIYGNTTLLLWKINWPTVRLHRKTLG